MNSLFCLALTSSVAFAKFNIPVTELASGVNDSSILLFTSNLHDANVYKIFVPLNATNIYFELYNPSDHGEYCSFLYLNVKSFGFPCYPHDELDMSEITPCANGYANTSYYFGDLELDSSEEGYFDQLAEFVPNQYLYASVSRGGVDESFNRSCPYVIKATVTTGCPADQVSFLGGYFTHLCAASVANLISGVSIPIPVAGAFNYSLAKLSVPIGTGNIRFQVNSSVEVAILGRSFSPAGDYLQNPDCSDNGYELGSNTSYYVYDVYCIVPRAGDYYFTVQGRSNDFNGSIIATLTVCSNGTGGVGCNFPTVELNLTGLADGVAIPSKDVYVPMTEEFSENQFYYFYADIPAGFAGANAIAINVSSTNGSGTVFVRKDAFPPMGEVEASGHEGSFSIANVYPGYSVIVNLNNYDFAVAGRYYIALSAGGQVGTNFTLSFDYTALPETNGGSTSEDSTGSESTGASSTSTGVSKSSGGSSPVGSSSGPASSASAIAISAVLVLIATLL